ncbi:hypothetical protein P3T35_007367 [Kitasatospora sp. GP30]|nr:hypothetical protein [Kitasatospora sp. GP30]MDH6145312.1 hypothetical protein [Kitasatospora sp. GP30]
MTSVQRERLHLTFTEDAELYAKVRPGYPAASHPRCSGGTTGS